MRKETARIVHSACACLLLLWSVVLALRCLSAAVARSHGRVSVCRARALALRSVDRHLRVIGQSAGAMRGLRGRAELPARLPAVHARLRAAASRLQRLGASASACGASPPSYAQYEFSLGARYPVEGALLYVFSVIGARTRVAVEIDDASGAGVVGGASGLSSLHGWDALSLCRAWSGAAATQSLFAARARIVGERFPETRARVVETPTGAGEVAQTLRASGVAGEVDLLAMFTENGQEGGLLARVREVRARVVVATYLDFLGSERAVVRPANKSEVERAHPRGGRDRLRAVPYAGASVRAMVATARLSGYRLVWCLSAVPVGVFVDEREGAEELLPTMEAGECFKRRFEDRSFEKDMAAVWELAKGEQF